MNKSEMVAAIATGAGITQTTANKVLDIFFSKVTDALIVEELVAFPKFGTFKISNRSARAGRNPQTGAAIQIKASRGVKFTPGKTLKEAVQKGS